LNQVEVMALWGSDLVALAAQAAEYERLLASALVAQQQLVHMESDVTRYALTEPHRPLRALRIASGRKTHVTVSLSFCRLLVLGSLRAIANITNATLSLQYEAQKYGDTYMAIASALGLYEVHSHTNPSNGGRRASSDSGPTLVAATMCFVCVLFTQLAPRRHTVRV
jgi:hypothetical protein